MTYCIGDEEPIKLPGSDSVTMQRRAINVSAVREGCACAASSCKGNKDVNEDRFNTIQVMREPGASQLAEEERAVAAKGRERGRGRRRVEGQEETAMMKVVGKGGGDNDGSFLFESATSKEGAEWPRADALPWSW